MALNERQERRLARQRGAGNRELKNADFGFDFASITLPARPSSRKTPRLANSRKNTPTPLPPKQSAKKDREHGKAGRTLADSASLATQTVKTVGTISNIPSGPRKTRSANYPTFQTPVTTGKRKRSQPTTSDHLNSEISGDELERDDERFRPHGTRTPATVSVASGPSSSRSIIPIVEEADELVGDFEQHQSSKGSYNAVNISSGRLSRTREDLPPGLPDLSTRVPATFEIAGRLRGPRASSHAQAVTASTLQPAVVLPLVTGEDSAEDSVDELSPEHHATRDSILTGTPDPQTMLHPNKTETYGVTVNRLRNEGAELSRQLDEIDFVGEAGNDDDGDDNDFSPRVSSGSRVRKKSKKSNSERHSKLKNLKATSTPAEVIDRREMIPIITHRPTLPDATILEDPLGYDPNPTQNPADVLAQVTSEMCLTFLGKFDTGQKSSNPSSRRAFKRQKKALKIFHHALQDSLFTISTLANTGTVLESRLRRNRRELSELRAELIGLKALRTETLVEKDKVRLEHSRRMEAQEQRRELLDSVQDIAYAINLGKEKTGDEQVEAAHPEENLDALYDSVVQIVGGQGLSARLRDFNFALTQAAQGLEGRA